MHEPAMDRERAFALRIRQLRNAARDSQYGSDEQNQAMDALWEVFAGNSDAQEFDRMERYALKATVQELADAIVDFLT